MFATRKSLLAFLGFLELIPSDRQMGLLLIFLQLLDRVIVLLHMLHYNVP
jgi:hypothetical protein